MQLSRGDQTPSEALTAFLRDFGGKRLGVAVSGGSDSLGLLHLVHDWGNTHGRTVFAATVDHGLRDEAAAEAARVGEICAGRGVAHRVLDWRDWNQSGNLQAEARAARYRLLADWARELELDAVLLGHTQDDLAENLLIRLSRRAGVDGLSAMASRFERDGQVFARPLLGVSREALREDLRSRGIEWLDDPSNENAAFDRVKARQALAVLAPLGIDTDALADVSRNLSDAREALEWQVNVLAAQAVTQDRGDLVVEVSSLQSAPIELRRRLLVAAVRWVSGADYAPRRASLGQVMAKIEAGEGTTLSGCLMTVAKGHLRVTREYAAVAKSVAAGEVWDGRWQLDGPWQDGMEIRALGEEGLRQIDDWRAANMPRTSLLSTPSVWMGETLVASPILGFGVGWTANILAERADFPLGKAP
ncbi:tRNA lysidine(34) synthetase TilS [Shimia sp. CNT1-13L.2]|uniref:tRNA lysidine(34) synthetase TilS n=1 Tax=Shimia sp. CNT1-13L.2 TaxID=2959663 RepID=UPI0020CCCE3F|nr:tRNA lysidine(34) synthetase TilS [Shimia sp. CNT1-13L.2]